MCAWKESEGSSQTPRYLYFSTYYSSFDPSRVVMCVGQKGAVCDRLKIMHFVLPEFKDSWRSRKANCRSSKLFWRVSNTISSVGPDVYKTVSSASG